MGCHFACNRWLKKYSRKFHAAHRHRFWIWIVTNRNQAHGRGANARLLMNAKRVKQMSWIFITNTATNHWMADKSAENRELVSAARALPNRRWHPTVWNRNILDGCEPFRCGRALDVYSANTNLLYPNEHRKPYLWECRRPRLTLLDSDSNKWSSTIDIILVLEQEIRIFISLTIVIVAMGCRQ